jgi:hypothetical protein
VDIGGRFALSRCLAGLESVVSTRLEQQQLLSAAVMTHAAWFLRWIATSLSAKSAAKDSRSRCFLGGLWGASTMASGGW